MKFLKFIIIISFISSCATVYKLNDDHGTVYYISKNETIKEFNYKGKDKYYNGYDIYSLDTVMEDNYYPDKGEKLKANFELKKKYLIYKNFVNKNNLKDTIWLDTAKTSICEEIYPFFRSCDIIYIYNNGQYLCYNDDVIPRKINFIVQYKGDSTYSFNNQPAAKCHVFEYFKNTEGIPNEYTQPIQILVSAKDGMLLQVSYCKYYNNQENWFFIRVEDYRRFLFANPRRLKRFLM
jgi:hypothetical protein